ncbi:MAG: endopeptidase La [Candidatus Eisenbacteria bacterium]|uniref:Lon protease n=1 Tax=Eiseniibacteriota bacterium TaxID=2212470 RepID=A0A7Y2EG22_UNCEI|nr:endopeptidase La [Candidatus Eisenbacteria bacterium]
MSSDDLTVTTEAGVSLEIPPELPIVPLKGLVAFPNMMFPLVVSEPSLLEMADDVLGGSKMIGLFSVLPEAAKPDVGQVLTESSDDPAILTEIATTEKAQNFTSVGTVAQIQKMLRFPDGGMRLLVQGVARVQMVRVKQTEPYMAASVRVIHIDEPESKRTEALRRNAVELFQDLVDASGYLSEELKIVVMNIEGTGRLSDFLGSNLNLSLEDKQALLEELDPVTRLETATAFMIRELEILALGKQIQDQVQSEMSQNQREFFLRQQLKAIQRELGEDDADSEIAELREQIQKAQMPEEAEAATLKELGRLEKMPPQAAEYTVAKNYIDWMLSLPWTPTKRPKIDIPKAERILNEDHYDLEEVKERILEYLAVRKLHDNPKSPILCLSGPPGVGKTSLGKSIARSLDRPFARLALGGLHDEAEIRGHRRTYIGAMPGRIIQAIVSAKAMDPVFMLDEIDKVGKDFRGDPTSALLEVLDPEQNNSFQDNYLNVPFDLSRVMFITTANALYQIPGPLRDRMEVIELPGYVTSEKVQIAKRYLIPKALEDNGIASKHLKFTQPALAAIANQYTREAGVRNLERQINRVARKVATQVARGKRPKVVLKPDQISKYLGKPKIHRESRARRAQVGVATGMAWTPFGGEILFIEASAMPGKGQLTLTGQLGNVMQESAQAARSWIRANLPKLGVEHNTFTKIDIHIHVPAGAMPKDGPSAGVAMVTALASLVTGRPVRPDTAMTGEISLRGQVLPIGGLKQKMLGAKRAGIKRVLFPAQNENDFEEIPDQLKRGVEGIPVSSIDEVLEETLKPKRRR